MAWNQAQTDELRELTKLGWTASQIGKRLGVSRNAVIGKWHRLGDGVNARTAPGWQPGSTERLRKMWIGGHTAGQIARELEVSEVAVKAKIYRLQARNTLQHKRVRGKVITPIQLALQTANVSTKTKNKAKTGTTVKFRNHIDSQCHYIFGDPDGLNTDYCAIDRIPGVSYCGEHLLLCTNVRHR